MIVDVDGVISDASHRQWYLDGPRRDWAGFFAACHADPPLLGGLGVVDLFRDDLAVVLLTARPTTVLDETLDWLARHDVRWDLLVMRAERDRDQSPDFKRRALVPLRRHGFEVIFALDDDIRIVEMYQAEDIAALYVHSGYYEPRA